MDNEIAELKARLVAEQLYCWLCNVTGNKLATINSQVRVTKLIKLLSLMELENNNLSN